jgi:copper resistance protein B
MDDDPILTKVMIDQLEIRNMDGPDPFVVEADAWVGKDLNKAWFKVSGERVDGTWESAEFEARYSRAVAPYWDFQVGIRHDARPSKETRDWAAVGFRGLAPYFFDVDSSLYLGSDGNIGLRLQAEYEIMFTQKLVLAPEAQANLYSKADKAIDQGSGLSSSELGVRLRYEIRREFAPYIGINWEKRYGQTADLMEAAGESTDDVQFVAGIRMWF